MTSVSSWAIVIDVTWKKAFAEVRKQGATPSSSTDAKLGQTGDTIAVLVNMDKSSYTQGALRLANTVTIENSAKLQQKSQVQAYTNNPKDLVIDYTSFNNVPAIIAWEKDIRCDYVWIDQCNGMDAPWGLFPTVQYVAEKCGCKETRGK